MSPIARILIADDSDDLTRTLRIVLETDPRYKVSAKASSGADAVAKVKKLRPDLVILDLQMPDMNGFEAARQIFEFAPATPILMYSMHCSTQHLHEAHKIGIRGYIQKGAGFRALL